MFTGVFLGLIFIAVQPAAAQTRNVSLPSTIPVIVLPGGESGDTCPSIQERETALDNITSMVHELVQSSLSLPGSPVPECGEGNWLQVVNLNMSDPSQQCPPEWREVSNPVRSCGRLTNTVYSCDSVFYSVMENAQYSRVCGRLTGHFAISQDAFALRPPEQRGINDSYVDGVSITYGSPRNHIFTLAAGHSGRCPCDPIAQISAPLPPTFVGDNYFCETEGNGALWDGEDCTNACCTFNSPPWFSVRLPAPTTDDIEIRICLDELLGNEDNPVSLIQLYIQ